jgi:hypothetical protein
MKYLGVLMAILLLLLSSCGNVSGLSGKTVQEDPDAPDRDNTPVVLPVEAPGIAVFGGNGATVDYSHANDGGYVMVAYEGENSKIKVQIRFSGGDPYTYNLTPNAGFQPFPLSLGNGDYEIGVFTGIGGDQYVEAAKQSIPVVMENEFAPFLRPSQYVWYTPESLAVSKAQEICAGAKTDLGAVEKIFLYVTDTVAYDYDKAATVQSGYLPNIDETLQTGKGICFDYASLITAMLRSQRIPCKLDIGYAGKAYHAWISIYSEKTGWIANYIELHDDQWSMLDPTFYAGGSTGDPNLIGDGTNYNPMYYY